MQGGLASEISEADYAALFDALASTHKGRAFLREFVERARPQQMRSIGEAIDRIEAHVASVRDELLPDALIDDLGRLDERLAEAQRALGQGDGEAAGRALERARAEIAVVTAAFETFPEERGEEPSPLVLDANRREADEAKPQAGGGAAPNGSAL